MGQKSGSSHHMLFYNSCLDSPAANAVTGSKMDSTHSELELSTHCQVRVIPNKEPIVGPLHKTTETEAVESTRRNCPSRVGSKHGTGLSLENSLKVRTCGSSELGWKKSKALRVGCTLCSLSIQAGKESEKSLCEMSSATTLRVPAKCSQWVWMCRRLRSLA